MENVVIDFKVDNTELLSTVELLEKIGQVEKGTAAEFVKASNARKAANEQAQQSTQELITDTQKLQTSLKELPKAIGGGALDQQFKNLSNTVDQVTTKTTSLKAQLRAMKNELATLDEGSKRFMEVSIEAGKLSQKITEVQQRVTNLAAKTPALNALIVGAKGITAGFELAAGSLAIFGASEEEVHKQLLKINAAMAILQGLQEIQELLLGENAAKSYLAAAAEKVHAYFIDQTTGALNRSRVAMAATGIGLFIIALGVLAKYLYDVYENSKLVADEILSIQEHLSRNKEAFDRDVKDFDNSLKEKLPYCSPLRA